MASFPCFQKYCIVLFLVICCSSVAAAATKQVDQLTDSFFPTTQPTHNPTTAAGISINDEYFRGFVTDFRSAITAPSRGDMSVGSVKEYLKDYFRGKATVELNKDGEESRWSLAPSLGKLSLNPLTNIKNMVMLLQYKF